MKRIILILILFSSCSKENFNSAELNIYSENKNPKSGLDLKNFQIKTLRQEITFPYNFATSIFTYNFQYNRNGTIDRLDITRQDGTHLLSYYVATFGNGIKMDSIVQVLETGLDQAYKNIRYKGLKITNADLYNARAYGVFYGSPVKFEYDKNGNLLNSNPWDGLIYDEEGFLTRSINKVVPVESANYSYEHTPNPLYIDNLFLMLINHDYFLNQFTFCKFNVSKKTTDGGVVVNYYNEYDQMGRLIKKSYTEREEKFELYFGY
jgi:hypothetical protein